MPRAAEDYRTAMFPKVSLPLERDGPVVVLGVEPRAVRVLRVEVGDALVVARAPRRAPGAAHRDVAHHDAERPAVPDHLHARRRLRRAEVVLKVLHLLASLYSALALPADSPSARPISSHVQPALSRMRATWAALWRPLLGGGGASGAGGSRRYRLPPTSMTWPL